jgi:hypothetical protein
VANINEKIAPALIAKGFKVTEQKAIDEFMLQLDGTENKGLQSSILPLFEKIGHFQQVSVLMPFLVCRLPFVRLAQCTRAYLFTSTSLNWLISKRLSSLFLHLT